MGVHWKDWCWSWNSSTLATSCKELTHWKSPWCWEGLEAGGEGDDRGLDGWMASPTRWTWVWVNSGSWWWTGRPGVLQFMGSLRVGHDWATELNWYCIFVVIFLLFLKHTKIILADFTFHCLQHSVVSTQIYLLKSFLKLLHPRVGSFTLKLFYILLPCFVFIIAFIYTR